MRKPFSAMNREWVLEEMAREPLDVLIIGGGITGAGIALDASVRGLKVGLLEKSDFGSGTSSRSTKLIHGGLRYLKQGEIKLVREVGRERAILFRNAPHLVVPMPMLLPIYKGGTYGYLASSIGLYIYDVLAGVARTERRRMLNREQTLEHEPLLKQEGLKGAGLYYEYRTDDARLTLDTMKTAWNYGASLVNYTEMTKFLYRDGKAAGVEAEDKVSGRKREIYARYIVNASGPWVDRVRQLDDSLNGRRLFLTKGVHLVVDYDRLPVQQAAYFDTPDGRMVFVIPRGHTTYIGTTDTAYSLSIGSPQATEEDRDYLIHAVNSMFPQVRLAEEDILSHWAGIRPLIYEEGKDPSELSRKDEIFISDSGLITITGGKLTGFRKMAEKVVDLVCVKLQESSGIHYASCTTDRITISGGERMDYASYSDCLEELLKAGTKQGVDLQTVQEWVDSYGANMLKILERLSQGRGSNLSEPQQHLHAQLMYSIEEEMTVTAADFLRLRTGWSYFHLLKAEKHRNQVIQWMAEALEWNDAQIAEQQERVSELFQSIYELPKN